MLVLLLAACAAPASVDSAPSGPRCDFTLSSRDAPSNAENLRELLTLAQAQAWPELDGVEVALEATPMSGDYFVASLDLATLDDPPMERRYRVNYNVALLDDPPPYAAVGAILAHELAHIRDYTGMEAEAMADFALWYAQADTAEYERATDLAAMERGCAEGLIAYRLWLYEHVDAEILAEKRRVYWTPEEIEAWIDAQG